MRTGTVTAKANKTDPVYQEYAVRDNDGHMEYYHPQLFRWCSLPAEWQERVTWADAEDSATFAALNTVIDAEVRCGRIQR